MALLILVSMIATGTWYYSRVATRLIEDICTSVKAV
jgi:hypothetical protein